jgi:acyl-CoA synthetase (AMP-forming)/AMP-acid ligase II
VPSQPHPTLVHNLAARAARHPDRDAVAFTHGNGDWSPLTYAALWTRASAVAELVRAARRRADGPQFTLIVLPNGLDYVTSFYGSLIAGAVAVPFFPPTTMTSRAAVAFGRRMAQIMRDCEPSLIILPGQLIEQVAHGLGDMLARTTLVAAEQLPVTPSAPTAPVARPDDLALLQYTSGSTTTPKGVMVSHGNLTHNVTGLADRLGSTDGESLTTWLPLFHDMGLIGAVCHPLAAGMSVRMMAPATFVRQPFLWLDTITRFRSTITFAPNFAYDMCVRWVSEEQRETLDLSCLRHAVNAAEPVRAATIDAFAKAYQRHGYEPGAMMPAYGMAENTLAVSVFDRQQEPVMLEVSAERLGRDGVVVAARDEPTTVLVGCGRDFTADSETVIVDPERLEPAADGTVGEIWVTSPSVAQGYWGQPEASAEAFAAELPHDGRRFLRTGDLGTKVDGVVYIVGRIRDIIIQHGVNHYPQDVEHTAERAHPAVKPGGVAVFVVPGEDDDCVVLVCELASYGPAVDMQAVLTAVRRAVAEEHGLQLSAAALVRKGQIPKTTSGKVKRHASAERWQTGGFNAVREWPASAAPRSGTAPEAQPRSTSVTAPAVAS